MDRLFQESKGLRNIVVAAAVAAAFACAAFAFGAQAAFAEGEASWNIAETNMTLSDYSGESIVTVRNYPADYAAPKVESSDNTVVAAEVKGPDNGVYAVVLTKQGVGDAKVTVTDAKGATGTIAVTCDPCEFKLTKSSFTFSKKTSSKSYLYLSASDMAGHKSDSVAAKATSSKKSVATVAIEGTGSNKSAVVTPVKAGKATVSVTDQFGRTKKCTVTVKSNFFADNLKNRTHGSVFYGSKTVKVFTAPKAKVTIEVGSDKKTKTADAQGLATLKLAKYYKVNTKYTITAKTKQAEVTVPNRVISYATASYGTLVSSKKTLPVIVKHATKGDTVTVTAGGKKYTHKVKSSKTTYAHTFTLKKVLKKYDSLKISVTNKYGQSLYDYTSTLSFDKGK